MPIAIDWHVSGLDRLIRELGEDDRRIQRATQRALKEVAKKVKVETAQTMAQTYNLPAARIKSAISIRWPSYTSPAIVSFSGKPPGLQHYSPREVRGHVRLSLAAKSKGGGLQAVRAARAPKTQGLTVEVRRGQRRSVRGAWLAIYNNAPGVFRRIPGTSSPRYPGKEMIDRLHGPSIMGMFNACDGLRIAREVVGEEMDREFTRAWRRYTR